MKRLLLLFILASYAAFGQNITPTELTCEYMPNPSVVDVLQPRLAWINVSSATKRGQRQTAYEVRVASSEKGLSNADLWSSGKVSSEQNDRVAYAGKPLTSRLEVWWQVRVWDEKGKESAWSKPAQWRMGLMARAY